MHRRTQRQTHSLHHDLYGKDTKFVDKSLPAIHQECRNGHTGAATGKVFFVWRQLRVFDAQQSCLTTLICRKCFKKCFNVSHRQWVLTCIRIMEKNLCLFIISFWFSDWNWSVQLVLSSSNLKKLSAFEASSSCWQFMTTALCHSNSGGRSDLPSRLLYGDVTSSSH